jgi:hypothetical protein
LSQFEGDAESLYEAAALVIYNFQHERERGQISKLEGE